jgi:hypothetical protein
MEMSLIFNKSVTLLWHNTKKLRVWQLWFCCPYDEHTDGNNLIFNMEIEYWG